MFLVPVSLKQPQKGRVVEVRRGSLNLGRSE
jgi:hypothetical protein